MGIYFTADTHFGHTNVMNWTNRPFENVRQMDECFIDTWNKTVRPRDMVYHLGDVAWYDLEGYVSRLNGRIILIEGNHDRRHRKHFGIFEAVYQYKTVKFNKQKIVVCHFPMRAWDASHYNSWHLFGHVHGRLDGIGKSIDIGVDNQAYQLVEIEELPAIMQYKPNNYDYIGG